MTTLSTLSTLKKGGTGIYIDFYVKKSARRTSYEWVGFHAGEITIGTYPTKQQAKNSRNAGLKWRRDVLGITGTSKKDKVLRTQSGWRAQMFVGTYKTEREAIAARKKADAWIERHRSVS